MGEEQAHEKNTLTSVKNSLVTFLKANGGEFPMTKALDSISGRDSLKYDAKDGLIKEGVIGIVAGVAHSKTNPSKLRLLKPRVDIWDLSLLIHRHQPELHRQTLRTRRNHGTFRHQNRRPRHPSRPSRRDC